ncbi:hypothetical protein OPKNFCMD_5463 [Methylobacterium crusticola]|uniref:Virulence-associated protein E n=1 Tax=Methylobacterium crusticola TaxID=1697972 RepID=A0ABQ4R5G7_9HYPH|nr:toprim domain-containing protein [Methylobacterium crusticola]GJD52697.1 hypothetical protein OPKNFCMD_5463 [Methylobacterium crusticola]
MTVSLQEAARALGGKVAGVNQILCPGPGHGPGDRSLSVRLAAEAPGGFVVHSFATDDPFACRDHVAARLGWPTRSGRAAEQPVRPQVSRPASDDAERGRRALELWHEARRPGGTPVEAYLARRGLTLPDADVAIRYHSSCPFAGSRTPAMVALVRDVASDRPVAVHRTALTADGRKGEVEGYDRRSLGPVRGGAIKLTPDEDVITCLGIAEGLETALSLQLLPEFRRSPVWSLISAGGIAAFPVLAGIEVLWIAVDHDPAGLAAAEACADRWEQAGREVYLVRPDVAGADINDVVARLQEMPHG